MKPKLWIFVSASASFLYTIIFIFFGALVGTTLSNFISPAQAALVATIAMTSILLIYPFFLYFGLRKDRNEK
jgi:hypothetical protein